MPSLPSLSVSVVVYKPAMDLLKQTLSSLAKAIAFAKAKGVLGEAGIWLIDNSKAGSSPHDFQPILETALPGSLAIFAKVISGHGNVGYGRGHNLAIKRSGQDYHLILNPDVILAQDAIYEALRFLEANKQVGLLAPFASNQEGDRLYLCKRYPAAFDLLLRGFAPNFVKRIFTSRLARYELQSKIEEGKPYEVEIISGCFMFARTSTLKAVNGFSDEFFMYFEDFDLSIRMSAISKIVYVPSVKIIHFGGEAAGKGLGHVRMFVESAYKFYSRNGWKIF